MLLFGSLGSSCFSSPFPVRFFYFTNVSFLPLNKRWNLKKLPQRDGEGAALSQPGPLDLEGATGRTRARTLPCWFWQGNRSGQRKCLLAGVPWGEGAGLQFRALICSPARESVRTGLSKALAGTQVSLALSWLPEVLLKIPLAAPPCSVFSARSWE